MKQYFYDGFLTFIEFYSCQAGFPTENIDDMEVEVEYESDEDPSDDDDGDELEGESKKPKATKKQQQQSNEELSSDDENEEKIYDVRAGRVNVVVEEIKFDPKKVVEMFNKIKYTRFANHKNKRVIKKIVSELV